MHRLFILVLALAHLGCASTPKVPSISKPIAVNINGWRFDKEHFTNDMNCHGQFLAHAEDLESYFSNAQQVSEKTWDKNTKQYACNIKGSISTALGECTYLIWEGGKGKLICPEQPTYYLINENL